MYTDDDTIGEILLDLFQKEDFVTKRRACLIVLEVVPDEDHLAEDRIKLRALLSSNLPEEQFVSEIVEFRLSRLRQKESPERATIPNKMLGLIIDLWFPTSDPLHLGECLEWIDQFCEIEEIDTTRIQRKMLEEFAD